jgi:excinuclease ABC subunit A
VSLAAAAAVVIKQDLGLIADDDELIDLEPEGRERGGTAVAWGAREQTARSKASRTAPYLRGHLEGAEPHRSRA